MKESKAYLIALVTAIFLSVVLCASPCFASDISSTNQAEGTITIPLTQWNELKANNAKALSLIETSSIPLTEAQSLVMKQKEELSEAHNTELIDRIERANKQRQENNQASPDATQPIPGSGSGSDNRSSNSSMTER